MSTLERRVERLEAIHAGGSGCPTCGACPSAGMALLGIAAGERLPAWVSAAGGCRECGRRVRAYGDVDLAQV